MVYGLRGCPHDPPVVTLTGRRLGSLIALLLVACTPTIQPAPDRAAEPGSPAVYARIRSLSDCDALQAEFDQAAANHDAAEPGSDAAVWSTSYMVAADARMREVGCYE